MPTAEDLGVESVYEVVTSTFQIEGKVRGDEFDMHCPKPEHVDSRPSCSINLKTGLWKCLSCGAAGDLVRLGVLVQGEEYERILKMLKPDSIDALRNTLARRIIRHRTPKMPVRRMTLPGPYEEGPLHELWERGFTPAHCERWGIRYVPLQELQGKERNFNITNSIGIPIRDANRRLLAWCYRRTAHSASWQPRYLYTPDVALSELWFGLQHHADHEDIVIVEGALDAVWLDQHQIPALALLGSEMGKSKLLYLTRYRTVTLFGDFDMGGINAVQRIGNVIGNRTAVRVVRYNRRAVSLAQGGNSKAKVDPQVLSPVDVELAVHEAIPWTTWLTLIQK